MIYEAELKFLQKLLKQFHLNAHIVTKDNPLDDRVDNGLRKFFGLENDYEKAFRTFLNYAQPNIIYKVSDSFFCNYITMILPSSETSEKNFLIIGPYTEQDFSSRDILMAVEKYQIPPKLSERLMKYFSSVPLIADSTAFSAIYCTFAETIWEGTENYTIKSIAHSLSEEYIKTIPSNISTSICDTKDIPLKMQILEKRLAAENQFLSYITQGNYHKAEIAFDSSTLFDIEKRISDPIRNIKNCSISMNTVLRKAAEQGGVHPIHIDSVYSHFVKRIETITTLESGRILMKEMIRRYGLLVKNHSIKDYSLLIQKVITRIEADLTIDQTLNTHAAILNVSPSYLSTLFRKETGITLTEFVNRKRVEQGVFLLNTTNMQIQMIAQHCGISDINYFTRIFKKQIGKTPKEYRNSIGR